MKEYYFTLVLREGCDEWWEELDALPLSTRLDKMTAWINETLEASYFEDFEVKNGTYYQMELDL